MDKPSKTLIRPIEAAKRLEVGRSTLYGLLGKELPVVKIGRSLRIDPDDLEAFIERQKVAHKEATAA